MDPHQTRTTSDRALIGQLKPLDRYAESAIITAYANKETEIMVTEARKGLESAVDTLIEVNKLIQNLEAQIKEQKQQLRNFQDLAWIAASARVTEEQREQAINTMIMNGMDLDVGFSRLG